MCLNVDVEDRMQTKLPDGPRYGVRRGGDDPVPRQQCDKFSPSRQTNRLKTVAFCVLPDISSNLNNTFTFGTILRK